MDNIWDYYQEGNGFTFGASVMVLFLVSALTIAVKTTRAAAFLVSYNPALFNQDQSSSIY